MNTAIFFFFYNLAHQNIYFDNSVIFFAVYFPYIVGLLALAFLFFYRKSYKEIILILGSSFSAFIVAEIFKFLFHTERPFVILQNVSSLFAESGYAFPSGHAAFFSALAFSIFLRHRGAGYWFILFALLIGLARIIAGVHFPIDIFAGFILGGIVAFFLKNIYNGGTL